MSLGFTGLAVRTRAFFFCSARALLRLHRGGASVCAEGLEAERTASYFEYSRSSSESHCMDALAFAVPGLHLHNKENTPCGVSSFGRGESRGIDPSESQKPQLPRHPCIVPESLLQALADSTFRDLSDDHGAGDGTSLSEALGIRLKGNTRRIRLRSGRGRGRSRSDTRRWTSHEIRKADDPH